MKKASNKEVTIDDLAHMVANGFSEVSKEIGSVKENMQLFRVEVNQRFEHIDARFDHIENLLIRAHENRIEKLEDDVRVLKTLVGKH